MSFKILNDQIECIKYNKIMFCVTSYFLFKSFKSLKNLVIVWPTPDAIIKETKTQFKKMLSLKKNAKM
jgi:hypothetical protein